MGQSIRTEIGVRSPGCCPVAAASGAADETINDVARSGTAGQNGVFVEEFSAGVETAVDGADVDTVFESKSRSVYRFERDPERGCACAVIEQYGCPVSDLHARDGTLYVSLFAPDLDTVQAIVNDLHDRFGDVNVRQLTRSADLQDHDFVFVDRAQMTERQHEVIETAHEMGYFEYPKGANASEVAGALEISTSTFSEHLAAAQQKILESLLR